MKYCRDCGNPMDLIAVGEGHWSEMYGCACGVKYEVIHGDMGGPDTHCWYSPTQTPSYERGN